MARKRKSDIDYHVVPDSPMDHFRLFLGSIGEKYSDQELQRIYDELHILAELLLDIYLWKKKESPLIRFDERDSRR